MTHRRPQLNAAATLALSFAGLILAGGGLLALPVASRDGSAPLPPLDALFTAASAACVTGLSVVDTATQFTFFGQAVLLALIQIGGLSFMTVSVLFSVLLRRRIGLRRRWVLMDAVGTLQVGGVVRLARRALAVTALWEGLGALALAAWFCPRYGLARGAWMALFHAVSAFCNAGFDLLGTGTSLTTAAGEPLLELVTMSLVMAGGLGFLVWDDLLTHRGDFRRYRLHSKIVLTWTGALFLLGAVGFLVLEWDGAFTGASVGEKVLLAAFQSVTCRTAGFAATDQTALSAGGVLLTLALMFIGAGSGSTGGGVKVNTAAVLVCSALAAARRRRDVDLFGRRLDEGDIRKAHTTVTLYALTMLAGCMVLCVQGVSLTDALFEAVSAMGTVGLSRNLTPSLPALSRVTVLLLMFAGRVGSMSVALAVVGGGAVPRVRRVPENILIG